MKCDNLVFNDNLMPLFKYSRTNIVERKEGGFDPTSFM